MRQIAAMSSRCGRARAGRNTNILSESAGSRLTSHDIAYPIQKRRDILSHGFPNNIRIDAEIPVGDHVSHADDRPPVDFGMAFPYLRRDFAGGLADYKEVVDDRIVGLGVPAENALSSPRVYACILPIASSMSAMYSLIIPSIHSTSPSIRA